jgi:hypothetical protein
VTLTYLGSETWQGTVCVSGQDVMQIRAMDPQPPDCTGTEYELYLPVASGDLAVTYRMICISDILYLGVQISQQCFGGGGGPPCYNVPCLNIVAPDCFDPSSLVDLTLDSDSVSICTACDSTEFEFTLDESAIGGGSSTYTVTV